MKCKVLLLFLSICICFGLLGVRMPGTVVASSANYASFSFDKDGRTLSISGKVSDREQTPFVVTVLDSDTPLSSISSSHLPVSVKMGHAADNGLINFNITLPQNLSSDTYFIYLSSEDLSTDSYFVYATDADIMSVLPSVNSAASVSELERVIELNAKKLGVDTYIFSDSSEKNVMSEYIYSVRPLIGYSNSEDFNVALESAHAWALIKDGVSVTEVLKKYGKSIGLNYETEFLTYPINVQTRLITLIENADYTSKSLPELVKELRVLAFVQISTSWSSLKEGVLGVDSRGTVYVDNFDFFDSDSTKYSELSDVNAVYMEMYRNLAGITTFDSAVDTFKAAVETAYINENSNGVNLGGGTQSGSGGGVAISQIPQETTAFNDINGHWAEDYINMLYKKGILAGFPDGSFRPDDTVTRAEFVKIICEGFQIKEKSDITFYDVSSGDWFSQYVNAAATSGLVTGDDLNYFLPFNGITREDACVILYRRISLGSDSDIPELKFSDKAQIAEYAVDAVGFLTQQGIVNGITSKNFVPKGKLTRAEAATLICRVFDYLSAH